MSEGKFEEFQVELALLVGRTVKSELPLNKILVELQAWCNVVEGDIMRQRHDRNEDIMGVVPMGGRKG